MLALLLALQDPQEIPLVTAVRRGDLVAVQGLLKQGADPNARETTYVRSHITTPGEAPYLGNTALVLAAERRSVAVARALLDKGADPNLPGTFGFTPLHMAVTAKSVPMAELLVSRKAKVDALSPAGDTPLVFAAAKGDQAMATLLLKSGAKIDGGRRWTPLMEAAYAGNTEMCRLLVNEGADPNQKRGDDLNPLELSVLLRNDRVEHYLRMVGGHGRPVMQLRDAYDARLQESERTLQTAEARAVTGAPNSDDRSVLEAVIAAVGPGLPVAEVTLPQPGPAPTSQIHVLRDAHGLEMTLDLRVDLDLRNARPVPMRALRLEGQFVPGTDAPYVQVSMPGYSPGIERAIVYYKVVRKADEEPATGQAYLIRIDGAWRVKWAEVY